MENIDPGGDPGIMHEEGEIMLPGGQVGILEHNRP